MHMLALYVAPTHVGWVSTDTYIEGLAALLTTLWQDNHILVDELLFLVCRNSWERHAHVDWAAEDALLPIRYLRRLSLYVNTWSISVADEGQDIDLYIIMDIIFYLYRHTFNEPHMPSTFVCTPLELSLTQPSIRATPSPDSTTMHHQVAHTRRVCWQPPADLLLINGAIFQQFISAFQKAV